MTVSELVRMLLQYEPESEIQLYCDVDGLGLTALCVDNCDLQLVCISQAEINPANVYVGQGSFGPCPTFPEESANVPKDGTIWHTMQQLSHEDPTANAVLS